MTTLGHRIADGPEASAKSIDRFEISPRIGLSRIDEEEEDEDDEDNDDVDIPRLAPATPPGPATAPVPTFVFPSYLSSEESLVKFLRQILSLAPVDESPYCSVVYDGDEDDGEEEEVVDDSRLV